MTKSKKKKKVVLFDWRRENPQSNGWCLVVVVGENLHNIIIVYSTFVVRFSFRYMERTAAGKGL